MGLRPEGSNPTARRLFCQEKYPWPFTTDPVKSPVIFEKLQTGFRSFATNEVAQDLRHAAPASRTPRKRRKLCWGNERQRCLVE